MVEIRVDKRAEARHLPHLVDKLAGKKILIPSLEKKYGVLSQQELSSEVERLYEGKRGKFSSIKNYYQGLWNRSGQKYLEEMGRVLEGDLDKDKYVYIAPSLRVNIADVLGGKNVFMVASKIQQVPLDFLLFHELTHLHYMDALRRLDLDKAADSPLMEGVDHLILFNTPVRRLFSGIDYKDVGFVGKNKDFMKKLDGLWRERKSFESFLKDAIKVNDKMGSEVDMGW